MGDINEESMRRVSITTEKIINILISISKMEIPEKEHAEFEEERIAFSKTVLINCIGNFTLMMSDKKFYKECAEEVKEHLENWFKITLQQQEVELKKCQMN